MKQKRIAVSLILTLALIGSVGCGKRVVAPVPGQLNTFDAYAFRVLADAQAALNNFKTSPSAQVPAIKTVVNQAFADYSIAQAAYHVWRDAGGNGDVTPVAAAIAKMQGDISGIASQTGGK